MKSKPLIIGHRGSSGSEPENTMRAFRKAFKENADGIELDIFLTRDKHIVVTHDENTKRLTGQSLFIRKSNLADLKKLNFGKDEKIPTLAEVFTEFLPHAKIINVEIKSTGYFSDGIEKKLAQLITSHRAENKVLVSSFNPLNLWRFRRLLPQVKIGLLICEEQSILAKHPLWIKWLSPDTYNLDYTLLNHKKYAFYVESQKPLWLWTVNTLADYKKTIHQDIAAIITNFPAQAQQWILSQKGIKND